MKFPAPPKTPASRKTKALPWSMEAGPSANLSPSEKYGSNCLEQALKMLPAAKDSGGIHRPFKAVWMPLSGRQHVRSSVVVTWFMRSVESYLKLLSHNLKEMGWVDAITISVPSRTDRLCLTVTGGGQSHLDFDNPTAYWNWTSDRPGYDPKAAWKVENLRYFGALAIPVHAYETGLPLPAGVLTRIPMPAFGRPKIEMGPAPKILTSCQLEVPSQYVSEYAAEAKAAAFDAKTLDKGALRGWHKISPKVLPDGREIQIIDWREYAAPVGRRVQSKLLCTAVVDHIKGEVTWADAETLAKFPEKGLRVPGAPIKGMQLATQLERLTLTKLQMIWAYWTGELPEKVLRKYDSQHSLRAGHGLDGVANLRAKGYLCGSSKEQEEIDEKIENGSLFAGLRDIEGKEISEKEASVSLEEAYVAQRTLLIMLGEIFAEKAVQGLCKPEAAWYDARLCFEFQAYTSRQEMMEKDENGVWSPVDKTAEIRNKEMMPHKERLLRSMTEEQRVELSRLHEISRKADTYPPNWGPFRDSRTRELMPERFPAHSRLPEFWVSGQRYYELYGPLKPPEKMLSGSAADREEHRKRIREKPILVDWAWRDTLIQEGFRNKGLHPHQYNAPLLPSLFEMAVAGGMPT